MLSILGALQVATLGSYSYAFIIVFLGVEWEKMWMMWEEMWDIDEKFVILQF